MHTAVALDGPTRILVGRLEEQLRLANAQIQALETLVSELRQQRDASRTRVADLETRVQDQDRKLAFYENANTPPSQPTLKPKAKTDAPGKKKPEKRGKPVGSPGATRKTPPVDRVEDVTAPQCPHCGSDPGPPTGVDVRTITERPEPAPVTTTQYNLATYACACGHEFTAPHAEVPKKGVWGPLILTHFALLHMLLRGRIRGCVAFLLDQDGVAISPKGFWDAIQRVGQACKPEYAAIREALRAAPYVYVDETKFKVKGRPWWLWTFRHPDGRVLVVLRRRRNAGVVKEIMGEDPPTLVVDGHSAYKFAKQIQRCWSHLLREVEEVLRTVPEAAEAGAPLLVSLQDVLARLKDASASQASMEQRIAQKAAFDEELAVLVIQHEGVACLEKAVTHLRNGLGSWTTCLLYPATQTLPAMEPTNNLSETAIREHAVVRKLIGTFRSEEGAENYQYLASMFESWRFQEKNPASELPDLLRRSLCMGAAGVMPPPPAENPAT